MKKISLDNFILEYIKNKIEKTPRFTSFNLKVNFSGHYWVKKNGEYSLELNNYLLVHYRNVKLYFKILKKYSFNEKVLKLSAFFIANYLNDNCIIMKKRRKMFYINAKENLNEASGYKISFVNRTKFDTLDQKNKWFLLLNKKKKSELSKKFSIFNG